MKSLLFLFFSSILCCSCTRYGQLKKITDLPDILEEASGVEKIQGSDILWMHNDSGNNAEIYGVTTQGNIVRKLAIEVKNNDWEDITSDEQGNLYIADFGNNDNKRKNLVIYKIAHQYLLTNGEVPVEKINFLYPDQTKYPPKKKDRFFDAESILYYKNNLYIFTKSRVKDAYGKTTLYRIPAKAGSYKAEYVSEFETCNYDSSCWITAASISPDKNKVALLNHNTVFVFSNFTGDNFFNGNCSRYELNHTSQKEGITFKDNHTVYITDEKSHGMGGNLYEFSLKINE